MFYSIQRVLYIVLYFIFPLQLYFNDVVYLKLIF